MIEARILRYVLEAISSGRSSTEASIDLLLEIVWDVSRWVIKASFSRNPLWKRKVELGSLQLRAKVTVHLLSKSLASVLIYLINRLLTIRYINLCTW